MPRTMGGDARVAAYWVDGYLPSRLKLENKMYCLDDGRRDAIPCSSDSRYFSGALRARFAGKDLHALLESSDDDLFAFVLGANSGPYRSSAQLAGAEPAPRLYVMRFDAERCRSKQYPALREFMDAESKRDPRYRQILTMHPRRWNRGFSETSRLLGAARFRTYPRRKSKLYKEFELDVIRLLVNAACDISEPNDTLEDDLESYGFRLTPIIP